LDSLSGRGHGSASKETASHGPAWQSCMSRECGDHAEATAGTHLVVAQQLGVDCGETHGAPRGPTETEAKQEQATKEDLDLTPPYLRYLVRLIRPFPDFDFFFVKPLRQRAVQKLGLKPGDRVRSCPAFRS
jgi:hypothetical protein